MKRKKRNFKSGHYAVGALIILAVTTAGSYLFVRLTTPAYGCVTSEEKRTVQGYSLQGVVNNGAIINILKGYYACNPALRNDLVVYHYSGSPEPLLKIVKAVPGDTFALVENKTVLHDPKSWTIYVNGQPLLAPDGNAYTVSDQAYKRFHLYEQDYGRGLPVNTYMLLGTSFRDSYDSRIFGLVSSADFIGKAEVVRNGPAPQ